MWMRGSFLVEKSYKAVGSMITIYLTAVFTLAISVILYTFFYWSYFPAEPHSLPVSFSFSPCLGHISVRCSYLKAHLSLDRNHHLLTGQAYTVQLELGIPDSSANQEVGMFMACMNLTSGSGPIIPQCCTSSSVQYRSSLLRMLHTLAFLPALLLGWTHQHQTILITFFENYQPDPYTPVRDFHIELQSLLLQVHEASLHLKPWLSGVRYLMHYHPLLSATLGIGTSMIFLSGALALSWASLLIQHFTFSYSPDDADLYNGLEVKDGPIAILKDKLEEQFHVEQKDH